jgi:8-oxo-dGTP pyrophosphatase MutT (NUDIX family)
MRTPRALPRIPQLYLANSHTWHYSQSCAAVNMPLRILFLSARNPDPDLVLLEQKAVLLGLQPSRCTSIREALDALHIRVDEDHVPPRLYASQKLFFDVVVTKLGRSPNDALDGDGGIHLLRLVRLLFGRKTFVVFHSSTACRVPATRWHLFQEVILTFSNDQVVQTGGCNMVSDDTDAIEYVLKQIVAQTLLHETTTAASEEAQATYYQCPYCGMDELTVQGLWTHCPLYHINYEGRSDRKALIKNASWSLGTIHPPSAVEHFEPNLQHCPICSTHPSALQPHIHDHHSPVATHHDRTAPTLNAFSLVVCLQNDQILLVQERSNVGYWMPGGHVDPGESLQAAALRETLEEAGVHIQLTGILQIQYRPSGDRVRMRVTFLAKPCDSQGCCKTIPDYESTGATWAPVDDVVQGKLRLRSPEPQHWIKYIQQGGTVHSLELLSEKV